MKKYLILVLACIAFQAEAQPITCTGAKACEKAWSDAQAAVSKISMMKIRLLTSDRIETYPPTMPGTLGATVVKVPFGDDGYEIKYQFDCFDGGDCGGSDGLRALGEKWFRLSMR